MNANKSDASPTVESRFALLESGIGRLNESLDKKYSELSTKLSVTVKTPKLLALADDLKKLKESVDQRCSSIESKLEAVRTVLPQDNSPPLETSTGEDIKQLWERCAELSTKITAATAVQKSPAEEERVASLESDVKQLRLTLDERVAEYAGNASKEGARETYVASLAENIQTLQEALETRFSELDGKLSLTVKAPKLQSIAEDLRQLRGEVADVNSHSSWRKILDERSVEINMKLDDSIETIKGELVTEIARVRDAVGEGINALQADLSSQTSKNKLDLEELSQQMQCTSMSVLHGADTSFLQDDDRLASIVQDVSLLRESLNSRCQDLSGKLDADIGRLQTSVEQVSELVSKVNTSIEGMDSVNSLRLNALTGTVELLQKNVNTKLGGLPVRAPVQSAEDEDWFTALWAEDLQHLQTSLNERYEEIESKLGLTLGEFRQKFENDIMDVNELLEGLVRQTNGLSAVVESPVSCLNQNPKSETVQERALMMPMDTEEAERLCRGILGQWQHEVHGESRTFTIQLQGGRPVFNQIVLSGGLQHKLEGVLVPEEEIEGTRCFKASLNVVDSNAFAGTVQLHYDAGKNSILSHFIKPSGETLDTCSVQVMPALAMIGESTKESKQLVSGQDRPIRKTDSPQEKNKLMASLTSEGALVISQDANRSTAPTPSCQTQSAQGLWKRNPESRGLSIPLASINEQGTGGFDEENPATNTSSISPPICLTLVRSALTGKIDDEPFQAFLRQQRPSEADGTVDSLNLIDDGVPLEITEDHLNLVRQSLFLAKK